MTDTPHFTAMKAYRAVYSARVGNDDFSCWMYPPEIVEQHIATSTHCTVDGYINFATLADHINAAIAEAVKAEREACAKLCEERIDDGEPISGRDLEAQEIATPPAQEVQND